jgi:hypothetical protein
MTIRWGWRRATRFRDVLVGRMAALAVDGATALPGAGPAFKLHHRTVREAWIWPDRERTPGIVSLDGPCHHRRSETAFQKPVVCRIRSSPRQG